MRPDDRPAGHDVCTRAALRCLLRSASPVVRAPTQSRKIAPATSPLIRHLSSDLVRLSKALVAGDRVSGTGPVVVDVITKSHHPMTDGDSLGLRKACLVELRGIEPLTYSMRTSRATNCATAPRRPTGAGERC